MEDYIVRATAANNQIRAFATTTREMVETAREHHNTSCGYGGTRPSAECRRYDGKHDEE